MTMRSTTPSFSSSSSSFPLSEPELPFFPSGVVPFSWEQLPGIPKQHAAEVQTTTNSNNYLPLPPSTTPMKPCNSRTKKKKSSKKSQSDPFAVAMLHCRREGDDKVAGGLLSVGAKLSRSFSFIVSCKQNCAVSDAIVRIPASSRILDTPPRFL